MSDDGNFDHVKWRFVHGKLYFARPPFFPITIRVTRASFISKFVACLTMPEHIKSSASGANPVKAEESKSGY